MTTPLDALYENHPGTYLKLSRLLTNLSNIRAIKDHILAIDTSTDKALTEEQEDEFNRLIDVEESFKTTFFKSTFIFDRSPEVNNYKVIEMLLFAIPYVESELDICDHNFRRLHWEWQCLFINLNNVEF